MPALEPQKRHRDSNFFIARLYLEAMVSVASNPATSSSSVDEMLIQVAEYFDKEVRQQVKRMTSLLEPALLLVGGVVVAFVVLSMFSAIFSINNMPL